MFFFKEHWQSAVKRATLHKQEIPIQPVFILTIGLHHIMIQTRKIQLIDLF